MSPHIHNMVELQQNKYRSMVSWSKLWHINGRVHEGVWSTMRSGWTQENTTGGHPDQHSITSCVLWLYCLTLTSLVSECLPHITDWKNVITHRKWAVTFWKRQMRSVLGCWERNFVGCPEGYFLWGWRTREGDIKEMWQRMIKIC